MSTLLHEFDWVMKNLNSTESKKQLPSVETLFLLWKKKYSTNKYKSKRFKKMTKDLSSYFFEQLNKREKTLWKP